MESKSLVNIKSFKNNSGDNFGKVMLSDKVGLNINFDKSDLIKDKIGEIKQDTTYHYYCRNEWGLHDIVIYIAQKIGPCKLYFCTWSIGNEAIITLNECKQQGLFSQIYGILSNRVIHNHPDIYNAACNAFDKVVLAELHAKVAVLENENWTISMFGSSNMTLNPRIERNAIVTDKIVAAADRDFLLKIIEKDEA